MGENEHRKEGRKEGRKECGYAQAEMSGRYGQGKKVKLSLYQAMEAHRVVRR
jgi:hypothetical protein